MTQYIYIKEDIIRDPNNVLWVDECYSLVTDNDALGKAKPHDGSDDWTQIVNFYRVELTTAVELYLLQSDNRGNRELKNVLTMEQARAVLYGREFRLGDDGIYRIRDVT